MEHFDAQGNACHQYLGFDFKLVKEIKRAVTPYSATAPYTVTLVETTSEWWFIPSDWLSLTGAVLPVGDFLQWKSEFSEDCKEIAKQNAQAGNGWTQEILEGTSAYANEEDQINFNPGIFEQIRAAVLKSCKTNPAKRDSDSSITKVKQAPDEDFFDFFHCLVTMSSRLFR